MRSCGLKAKKCTSMSVETPHILSTTREDRFGHHHVDQSFPTLLQTVCKMDIEVWRRYVLGIFPNVFDTEVEIERLTGGVVNSTVRLTLLRPLSDILRTLSPNSLPPELAAALSSAKTDEGKHDSSITFPDATRPSFVLKHAPAHMPGEPDSPLSVFRQTVEARALKHLQTDAKLSAVLEETAIAAPRLVWHDEPRHILWITDLGALRTLTDYISARDVNANGRVGSTADAATTDTYATAAGERLGNALAGLHSAALSPHADFLEQFEDPAPKGSGVAGYLGDLARKLIAGHGHDDSDILAKRIGLTISAPPEDKLYTWSMVDLWPGSVLLPMTQSDDSLPPMALVDWEFAAADHPGSEVGMLLAHIAGLSLQGTYPANPDPHAVTTSESDKGQQPSVSIPTPSASVFGGTGAIIKQRSHDFASAFVNAYMHAAPSIVQSSSFPRMALQSYGREMVVRAEFEARELSDGGKAKCIAEGVACLRAAGTSDAEVDFDKLGLAGTYLRRMLRLA